MSLSRFRRCLVAVAAAIAAGVAVPSVAANAGTVGTVVPRPASSGVCPPSAYAVGFSDAMDKKVVGGATIGGLSNIAYDPQLHSYASTVDNHADDPSRIWFYDNTIRPHITRAPLVLKQPDGTPYTGLTADNEGLAVLPNGDILVSSELEPSIRIFGRDRVRQSSLEVPSRFRVAPAGEATANATLEGLTISRDGQQIVASMEGTLSGDTPASGAPAGYRRFLLYSKGTHGWTLDKQVGYRVDDGNRIAEVQE